MQFDSFADFIAMGNHGFYVWISYGACLLLIVGLIVNNAIRDKTVRKEITKRIKREHRLKQAAQQNDESNEVLS
ncbi:heme exporter protein CcmD [Thalassotalea fusca]